MDLGKAGTNTSPRTENSLSLQIHQPDGLSRNANCNRVPHNRRHGCTVALPLHTLLWKLPSLTGERNLCPVSNLQSSLQQRTIDKQQCSLGIDNEKHPLPCFQCHGSSSGNAHVLPVFWRTVQAPIRDPLGDRNHFDHGRTIPRRCWSEIRSERADPDHVSRMVLYESLRVHQG